MKMQRSTGDNGMKRECLQQRRFVALIRVVPPVSGPLQGGVVCRPLYFHLEGLWLVRQNGLSSGRIDSQKGVGLKRKIRKDRTEKRRKWLRKN